MDGGARLISPDLSKVPVVACNLCSLQPPTDPVITTCGHSFCWPCMFRHLQGQLAKPCPVCATMLSSDINVVPYRRDNGALMMCLPSTEDLERNYDVLDWIRTQTELARALLPEHKPSSTHSKDLSEKSNVVVVFDDESNNNCKRNVFLTSRIEEWQWLARRAARKTLHSWESWRVGRKPLSRAVITSSISGRSSEFTSGRIV